MPNPLSQTQTRQVREEINRHMRRAWTVMLCVIVALTIGAVGGVWAYAHTNGYARTVSCKRGQALSVALRLVVTSAIPRHEAGRTPDEQRRVDQFYKKVGPALKIPSCN